MNNRRTSIKKDVNTKNPLINDLLLYYGLYKHTHYKEKEEHPFIIFDDDKITYSIFDNKFPGFSYNKKAMKCIYNNECDPKDCHMATNLCVAKKCTDNSNSGSCIESKIDFPLEVTEYNDIYVDSKYDGSKWKLHKIIPFHINNTSEKELEYIIIFKPVYSNHPNIVCFPYGEILNFNNNLIYSNNYEIIGLNKGKGGTNNYELSIKKQLDINGIIKEILDNPNEKYLFCGHSMGCVIAQYMIKINWQELESLKKNCSLVGSGGYNIFTQDEIDNLHINNRISLYIYGKEYKNELLVDYYLFSGKIKKENVDIPLFLLKDHTIKPVFKKDLKPCYNDDENRIRTIEYHNWNTYRKEIEIIARKNALKNKTRYRTKNRVNKNRIRSRARNSMRSRARNSIVKNNMISNIYTE
jgi:hypothetical protein